MTKKLSFETIVAQFKSKNQYEKFLNQSQTTYQLKVYRVNTMTIKQATDYYNQLKLKYEKQVYQVLPFSWHQNQRRLYIWLIICYIRLKGNKAFQDQTQWQDLSEVFFEKDFRLLKYQYMNIIKRNGRVLWSDQQDQILKQVYQKYQKGQWNQIAKQIFMSGKSKQFKSPKHCRERWNNHLNQQIKKDPWTDEEDLLLLNLIKQKGKKWSSLAQQLNNKRTQHQIKNRYNSLITHAQKMNNQEDTLQSLISLYQKKKQSQKFTFFNNIIVVKQQQKPSPSQNYFLKKQQQKNQQKQINQQKKQHITAGGMSIIYCGNKPNDRSITTAIQDKLFGSTSQLFSDAKSQNFWMDKSIVHTPGHYFFEDSNCFQKKFGDFKFRLESKGSFDKSQIAASMQFLRPARSDISQQLRNLSSSNADIRTGYQQFSCDFKQL